MEVDDGEDIARLLLQHRQDLFTDVIRKMAVWDYRFPPPLTAEQWWPQPVRDPQSGRMRTREEVFDQVFNYIADRGVTVRTKVEWLVTHVEYRKLEQRWSDERQQYEDYYEAFGGSPTGPWDPLLAITVEPRSGLNPFPVARYRDPNEPFHVSLGHYWELGPDIYDRGNIMENLLRTFHHKTLHLVMDRNERSVMPERDDDGNIVRDPATGEPRMYRNTGLQLDRTRDPIASNPWVRAAKARSRHGRRPPHISL